MKFLLPKKTTAWVLATAIAGFQSPILAQTPLTESDRNTISPSSIIFAAPLDLTDRGRPGDRDGGATRGSCPAAVNPRDLVALIPDTEQNPSVGLTTDGYPTFWVNVPYPKDSFHAIEFMLSDEDEEIVYRAQFDRSMPLPGVVSFRIPETAEPLEAGKTYNWFIRVDCEKPNPQEPVSAFVMAGGTIIRVEPTPELERDLSAAETERDKAIAYARHGIWYNALTTIGNLHRKGSAAEEWQELLDAIELEDVSSQPIVDCCIPPSEPGHQTSEAQE